MSTPPATRPADLLGVGGDQLVEGRVAPARVLDVDAHRELLLGRADAAGDEARLVGVIAGEFVGRAAGQLGGRLVDLEDVLLEAELLERYGRAVERVGLDDVGARFQVRAMDLVDDLGLGQDQGFGTILDAEGVPREPASSDVLLGELIRIDEGAHRAVEDHDPPRQDLFEPAARVCDSSVRHQHWITRRVEIG